MKSLIKKITKKTPRFLNTVIFGIYENFFALKTKKYYLYTPKKSTGKIKNILFYPPSGLSFGGTEKFLQIIAKYIDKKKYNVFYMYSDKNDLRYSHNKIDGRKYYLENEDVNLINFNYSKKQNTYPYIYEDMSPSFYDILKEKT
jgi:hypothetical protein